MQPMEIGRRMAQLGQKEDAQKAYTVALAKEALSPMERFEAASYIFFSQGNYKTAYTALVGLYNEGHFRQDIMHLLAQAFTSPTKRNCGSATRPTAPPWPPTPTVSAGISRILTNCPCGFSPLTTKVFFPMTRRKTALAPMSISTTRSSTGIFSKI